MLTGIEIDDSSLATVDYMFRQFPGRLGVFLPSIDETPEVYLVTKRQNKILHRVAATGNILSFAGSGQNGYAGDGDQAVDASFSAPVSVASDQFVNVGTTYFVDRGNDVVRHHGPG
ncbi:MAG: hypothetical protein GY822_24585 [Deltaproteobacteria bacterium]|nr:hypothetical protein [Deltaproteobacteria bacterium]